MSEDQTTRDDRQLLNSLNIIPKVLLGISLFVPSSGIKKLILRLLGASIGKDVYLGPGSLIISQSFKGIKIGDGVFIAPGTMIFVNNLSVGDKTNIGYQSLLVGGSLVIGANCNISNRAFIESTYAPVVLENNVTLGGSVMISSHDGSYRQTHGLPMKCEAITIKERAFVGNNAVILPGITIGEKAIVGAGAVVTRDVKENSVVAGVPAVVIKQVDVQTLRSRCMMGNPECNLNEK